jgi:hypothetical protein
MMTSRIEGQEGSKTAICLVMQGSENYSEDCDFELNIVIETQVGGHKGNRVVIM